MRETGWEQARPVELDWSDAETAWQTLNAMDLPDVDCSRMRDNLLIVLAHMMRTCADRDSAAVPELPKETSDPQGCAPELPARPKYASSMDWYDYAIALEAQLRAANERAERAEKETTEWETRYTVLARAEAAATKLAALTESKTEKP